jgi:hypothetical protein
MKTTVRLGADSAGTVLMSHWPETFLAFSWPRWINRRTVSSVTPNILATCLTDRYVTRQLTPPQYNPLLKQMCGSVLKWARVSNDPAQEAVRRPTH